MSHACQAGLCAYMYASSHACSLDDVCVLTEGVCACVLLLRSCWCSTLALRTPTQGHSRVRITHSGVSSASNRSVVLSQGPPPVIQSAALVMEPEYKLVLSSSGRRQGTQRLFTAGPGRTWNMQQPVLTPYKVHVNTHLSITDSLLSFCCCCCCCCWRCGVVLWL